MTLEFVKETEQTDKVTIIRPEEFQGALLYFDPELKPHKKNEEIYGKEQVDLEMVDSIKSMGQIHPIVINQDKEIISGHRRRLALIEIKKQNKIEAERMRRKEEK